MYPTICFDVVVYPVRIYGSLWWRRDHGLSVEVDVVGDLLGTADGLAVGVALGLSVGLDA